MANNYSQGGSNQENVNNGYYDNQYQSYQAEDHLGPFYENSGSNRRGYRGQGGNRGHRGDYEFRPSRSQGYRGSRSRRGSGQFERGRGNPRGERRGRGNFDPLPTHVNWTQQLEKDRTNASLNWAPSFRAANITIPAQFFSHTREEQSVLGQELMDLAESAAASSQTGTQQAPGSTNAQPLDMAALDMEASNVAGE